MSEGTTSYSALLCSNVVQFHFINSFLWTSESQLRGSTLLCFHSASARGLSVYCCINKNLIAGPNSKHPNGT